MFTELKKNKLNDYFYTNSEEHGEEECERKKNSKYNFFPNFSKGGLINQN